MKRATNKTRKSFRNRVCKDDVKTSDTTETNRTPWLQIWWTLRSVNLKELWPVIISVPTILFFTLSGLLAWLVLLLKFVVGIFRVW